MRVHMQQWQPKAQCTAKYKHEVIAARGVWQLNCSMLISRPDQCMFGTSDQAGRSLSYSFSPLVSGAQAIAQALKSNSTLVSLGLSQCGLTDMGGAQLALSLADNRLCLLYLCGKLPINPRSWSYA